MNEGDVEEMVGERKRASEGDVGEVFPASSCGSLEDSFLVLVILRASVHQSFHRPRPGSPHYPVRGALPDPTQLCMHLRHRRPGLCSISNT